MSNLGKNAIICPENILLSISINTNNSHSNYLIIYGKYGMRRLTLTNDLIYLLYYIKLYWSTSKINITRIYIKLRKKTKKILNGRILWGSLHSAIEQSIVSVSQGFTVQLKVTGLGYRAYRYKNYLLFIVGHSVGFRYKIPKDIDILCFRSSLISLFGLNLQRLKQIAYQLRLIRKPNIYKNKGIKYVNEKINYKKKKKKI